MEDTPAKIGQMVKASFKGTGTKKIMLIAHMDTVYLKGMLAKQPFRIVGNKAYGLAIADDKLSLATAGIGAVSLKVQGKASHAGSAPEKGVNALYELAHQVLQMRDLSDPATGLKMNWTLAQAGTNRNVIPAAASAEADVRVTRVADYDRIEKAMMERVKTQLVPDAKVELRFERRRPPLEANPASVALGRQAQLIYREVNMNLVVDDKVAGGGTDAAFAGLGGKAGVVERFGLMGYGAHSADAEYVLIDSIEFRLYLVARLVMDISRGKVGAK